MEQMQLDYTVETAKSVEQATADVERLSAEKSFRVLATHDVAATLASKGFEREPMRIVEICNAKQAYQVLKADPKISLMLPCPISVYAENGKTYISMMLPTVISQFYPQADVKAVAIEVERVMREIVEEAS